MARRKSRKGKKKGGHASARCRTTKRGKLIKSTCHKVKHKKRR